jgi:biopolymer transport protein ExbB
MGMLFFTGVAVFAQAEETVTTTTVEVAADDEGAINVLKQKFIEGGPLWMTPILVCLIFGLALCIERIITLNLATSNTNKLIAKVDSALKSGNLSGAKEACKSTPGPVASVLHAGLDRTDEGIDIVEKSIVSYGSVQMGSLEKGLIWISLFIALAPMLGFLGTVVGMIIAFDQIQASGEIRADQVAGGIKVALLTTVFGLIVAIILQVFYNYIVSKIDSLVSSMEDSSIALVDSLVRHNIVSK